MDGREATGPDEGGLGTVRPYVPVRGRTRPSRDLDRTTLVTVSAHPPGNPLQHQHQQIAALCAPLPCSVAEIAGTVRQPLQVVKVLVSDLIEDGYLVHPPPPVMLGATALGSDTTFLEDILDGLRKL
jgi:hypothetical protein